MKYNKRRKKGGVRLGKSLAVLFSAVCLSLTTAALPVTTAEAKVKYETILTADGLEDYMAETAANKKQPIQTNEVKGWPSGPAVGAAGDRYGRRQRSGSLR